MKHFKVETPSGTVTVTVEFKNGKRNVTYQLPAHFSGKDLEDFKMQYGDLIKTVTAQDRFSTSVHHEELLDAIAHHVNVVRLHGFQVAIYMVEKVVPHISGDYNIWINPKFICKGTRKRIGEYIRRIGYDSFLLSQQQFVREIAAL